MAKNKTTFTQENVADFIHTFTDSPTKQQDSLQLIDLMEKVTGKPAVMWGPSIVGFGKYHYQYASGHQGDAPTLGFSPRKAAISLYVFTGLDEHAHLLEGLGKFKMGKACIYVNKLADIDLAVLENLMRFSLNYLKETYSVE